MRRLGACLAGAAALWCGGGSASAASASVILPLSTFTAWTGDSVSDPRGLAFEGGAFYFFEGRSVMAPDANAAGRSLIRWHPTSGLVSWISRAEIRSELSDNTFSPLFTDVAPGPPGSLIFCVFDQNTGREKLFLVVGQAGLITILNGTQADGTISVAYHAGSGRVYMLATTAAGAAVPGVHMVDISGSLPAPSTTLLASEADLRAALTTSGTAPWLPTDMAVQSDGDVLIYHSGANVPAGDLQSDGDCLRITPAGAVSLFFDRSRLDALVGDPGTTGYGDAAIEVDPSDHLLLLAFADDPDGTTTVSEFLARISPDGSSAQMIATEQQVLNGIGGTDVSFTRRALTLDASGRPTWVANGAGSPQGILQWSGAVPVELSVFEAR